MLELARKLADCDTHEFDGWVLAGAQVRIDGSCTLLENSTLLKKERRCVIQVLGTDAAGGVNKSLQVFLVLPKAGAGKGQEGSAASAAIDGQLLLAHSFTADEVAAYVDYTGDLNVIHSGEHPIVPGLCLAAYVQQKLGKERLDWKISFLAPVYAGDELRVYGQADGQLIGYVGSARVFSIKAKI